MSKIKRYLAVLGSLLLLYAATVFGQTSFSEQDIIDMIKNAPSQADYPQAGALILMQQKVLTVKEDGSSQMDEHLVIKILNDRGKERYGDQKRKYDVETDSMIVITARSFRPDMTVMPVEKKAINDITPPELANASVYANLQQKVVSFPALAPGVSMELKLQTLSKAPEEKNYWGIETFQTQDPILFKEFTLILPEDADVKYVMQHAQIEPEMTTVDGVKKYTWKVEEAEQILSEPDMPPEAAIAPRLLFTSVSSWDEVGNWFSKIFYPKVQTGKGLDEEVKRLVADAKTQEDKIEGIYLYVTTQVREVAEATLRLGEAGYQPHSSLEVYANKYGDWRDKAVLLVAMLRKAGIESYPVLINQEKVEFAKEIPTPKQFNSLFVLVPREGKEPLWLNPFADHCQYGYFPFGQGSTCLVVKPEESELMTAMDCPPEKSLSLNKMRIVLFADGTVKGEVDCQLDGYFDYRARARLKESTPKEVEQFFLQAANSIGEGTRELGHTLSDLRDLTQPVRLTQSFETPELGVVEGEMMIFRISSTPFYFARNPFYPGLAKRRYDFLADTDMVIRTEGTISLPEGYKVAYIPQEVKIENEFGSWSLKFQRENGKLISYQSVIILKSTRVKPWQYTQFKKSFDDFSLPKNRLILLEKG